MRFVMWIAGLTLAVSLAACAGDEATDGSPTEAETTGPASTSAQAENATVPPDRTLTSTPRIARFDADSVWEPDYDLIAGVCGVDRNSLAPDLHEGQAECIAQAMTENGASPTAMAFLEETGQFLISFEEHGIVDAGLASALWYNMSRPDIVFLNSVPSDILFVSQVTPSLWERDERYAAVIQRALDAFDERVAIWYEYSFLTPLDEGEFLISYPLQACRPCEVRARVQVRLSFDVYGVLVAQELLPPILQ